MTALHGFGSYSLKDFQAIFDLSTEDLNKKILVYGAGASPPMPATSSWTWVDPFYQLSLVEMNQQIDAKYQTLQRVFQQQPAEYSWSYFKSAGAALAAFKNQTAQFLTQFKQHPKQYFSYALPKLPFLDRSFDLILSLDAFFIPQHDLPTCLNSLSEFKRIAHEIRIFPLVDKTHPLFPVLGQLILNLQQQGFGIEIKQSPFTLRLPADALLKIWSQTCPVQI